MYKFILLIIFFGVIIFQLIVIQKTLNESFNALDYATGELQLIREQLTAPK